MKILPPEAPDTQEPVWDYTIDLTGVIFRIVLTYRERQDGWYLDLYDADDVLLLAGKRLSVDWLILRSHIGAGMPAGHLMLYDTSGAGANCGYEDLGSSHLLYYFEPEDIPAATAAESVTITVTSI